MLNAGQRVRGLVVRHEAYGALVDIGESDLAALLLDALIDDDPRRARDSLPAVGDEVEAVFLGYGPPRGTQPRISIRPSDFAGAEQEA